MTSEGGGGTPSSASSRFYPQRCIPFPASNPHILASAQRRLAAHDESAHVKTGSSDPAESPSRDPAQPSPDRLPSSAPASAKADQHACRRLSPKGFLQTSFPAPRSRSSERHLEARLFSSSIVSGTFPPNLATSTRAAPWMFFAFDRKKPVDCGSSAPAPAAAPRPASSAAWDTSLNSSGVTLFTPTSVVCADRIVAIVSSKAL